MKVQSSVDMAHLLEKWEIIHASDLSLHVDVLFSILWRKRFICKNLIGEYAKNTPLEYYTYNIIPVKLEADHTITSFVIQFLGQFLFGNPCDCSLFSFLYYKQLQCNI